MKLMSAFIFAITSLFCGVAFADVVLYQDPALFQAAAPAGVTETFEGYAPPGGFVNVSNSTVGNLSYGDNSFIVDPDFDGGGYNWNTGAVLDFANPYTFISTLSFAPTTAFSALFGTVNDFGQDIVATINGESFLLTTGPFADWTFYGFISDTAFSSISFYSESGMPILDNVFLSTESASVPEPASLPILGLGLLALVAMRRRQARN